MPPLPEGFNPFAYHKPEGTQIERIETIREAFFECYNRVIRNTNQGSVSGRYLALSKTAMEEAAMWATKAIVFEQDNQEAER